ncbi:TonB-dependent siderophore receptor [Diaphorobacter aerolatus]|uniref:TonB-dependent siderophore receptor n=1 Tax=Diaphorobacter aerolatus TaxID=1288495 RepID=UPI001D0098D6|nr:TonB-dependent receptor plug domain-containing protein [Diaphorobacter aerolatus]
MHPKDSPEPRSLNVSLAAVSAAVGAAIAVLGGTASAQTSTVPAAKEISSNAVLPTVTVTADSEDGSGQVSGYSALRSTAGSKTDTPIVEIPQSVSVITADRVEAIGATTVRDALGYTPGIGISPYGADSRYDWITVRGFDAYSPGFYQDGLPLRNANSFAVWKVEPYGAERIDVLRGPSSVLYGQGSAGGVVDVVSKLPTATPVRELQLQYGSHSRKTIAGDFGGALDADGKVLYRIVGLFRDGDLPEGGARDDRTYLAPSLSLKLSNDTKLTLYAQLMRNRAGVNTRVRPWSDPWCRTPSALTSQVPCFPAIAISTALTRISNCWATSSITASTTR